MFLMYLRKAAVSCAAASLVTTAALAQTSTNYTSIEATADKQVQLTYHATAHKTNCTPAPLPTVHVIEAPKSGTLTVKRAVLTTDKIAGCGQMKVPAQVVFYQARAGYTGPDHVSYEVKSENGEDAIYDVKITVKPGAGQTPPTDNNTTARPI